MDVQKLHHSKWLRRLAVALAAVLLFWGLAWLALPPWLKTQLETRLGEQLGRPVSVGQIEFKPWSLELTVHDFKIAQAGAGAGAVPQLFVKRLYVDAELQSLLKWAPVVDAITLEAPQLRLTHLGQGRYDLDDVMDRLATKPSTPASDPLRFALYNLVLADGAIEFTDAPHQKTHQLSQLQIKLPFLSNLATQRDVVVVPQLAFALDGSRFDSAAQSTPFAQSQKTALSLKVSKLDLTPYFVYQPASLPLRLTSAVLDADLKLAFEKTPEASVRLEGQIQASQVTWVSNAAGNLSPSPDLLAFSQLTLELKDVQPLLQNVQLASLTLSEPRLSLTRDRAGRLNWLALLPPAKASPATADKAAKPWKVSLDQLTMQGGQVLWQDASIATHSRLQLSALDVSASAFKWPMTDAMPFEGQARFDGASLAFKGSTNAQSMQLSAQLADLPLAVAAPYLAEVLQPRLDGILNTALNLRWQAPVQAGQAQQLEVQLPQLTLDQLTLAPVQRGKAGKTSLASIKQLQLRDVTIDVTGRSASLGQISVSQPQTRVLRAANGRWMFEDWLTAQPPQARTVGAAAVKSSASKPWTLAVQQLDVQNGLLGFVDQSGDKPVSINGSAIVLQLKNFSTVKGQSFGLNLAARVQQGRNEAGRLAWRGSGKLTPLQIQGQLTAQRLPLHALEPYLTEQLNVELLHADASFQGQVNFAQQPGGMRLKVQGDTSFEDFRANTLAQAQPFVPGEDLLNWKALSLRGLSLELAPGVATRFDVKETVLSDFYARLILSPAGRFNLQDVLKPAAPSSTVADAPAVSASAPELSAVVNFGPVSLLGGRVDFSDRFIQPNYSADLTELTGKLSAFSSQAPNGAVQLADLELHGRAQGTASLEVLGKINPLVKPLALDITGKVRDLELPPLSPYSARYAGYGIERGKLSVDINYQVQPDGRLSANHKIVLNQLKFGDAVPDAKDTLPVKLAVALLADRHGVIDINLPVSGSLSDPQFRIGPIVFKLIVNLIVKAITAPFSLLASALGGGGEELSMVNFAPGSASLSPEARTGLDKVAKALLERPALSMTVVGSASLAHERDAYKRAQLQALVLAEKRRGAVLDGATAEDARALAVSAQDYPVLLKAVYKRADFPKPRNLIGLAKDIPVPEMEALLLANLSVTEAAMRALAEQRGVAVRDYLASLKLPMERLFLGATKAAPDDAKWQPRAELNLATQ
ncbi:DUF748 domain-containing protein [Rhodoferax sp.]|uniref:DUF748 domain-containing protein n=1 Tax=Rhodoferax sp. TaxID=50421 RepID=UPI002731F21B|nr:DUF748 domain-containing protein [Rhodoferax sp.]MDP1528863.1 DUF748 domain-containing protein [Rhodoferax sp.]MDP1943549.1 DUF748 domain-containing protein [Rhodoferax sp.]MDP2442054.1 DUF748 domain-containing protein [Rhodoferax sp.]MDZ4206126.1 DUF748 domain-containing protein [Rhodoferax sp.]